MFPCVIEGIGITHNRFYSPTPLKFEILFQQEVARVENSNILYSMLESLYLLVLHGDMLSKNLKDYAGFIIWCQENLIIRKYVGKSSQVFFLPIISNYCVKWKQFFQNVCESNFFESFNYKTLEVSLIFLIRTQTKVYELCSYYFYKVTKIQIVFVLTFILMKIKITVEIVHANIN